MAVTDPQNPRDYDARRQLNEAHRANSMGDAISRSSQSADGTYAVGVGLAIGLFLLAFVYTYPLREAWLNAVVNMAYLAAIGVATVVYVRRRRASSLGWRKLFYAGFVLSIVSNAAGAVIAHASPGLVTPLFWLPYAAFVAAPLVIIGLLRSLR